jgi:hypothetical protein
MERLYCQFRRSLSSQLRQWRIVHAAMVGVLAFLGYFACSTQPAPDVQQTVVPLFPLLVLFVPASLYTAFYAAFPFLRRAADAKARRIVLGVILGMPDFQYSRFAPRDAVRLLWMFYLRRMNPARPLLVASALLFMLFRPVQTPWTPIVAIALVIGYALCLPSRRRAVRWIARQLTLLDEEQAEIKAAGQVPAYLTRPPRTVWDPVCGLPLFRIAAALIAALVFATMWPHLTAAPDDLLPVIIAMPFLYMLMIVALLGRNWQKGLPPWVRTSW